MLYYLFLLLLTLLKTNLLITPASNIHMEKFIKIFEFLLNLLTLLIEFLNLFK